MSGRRTKQLRAECARRLGRNPQKADGHVKTTTLTVERKSKDGSTFLQRMIGFLKPKPIKRDEFRFFKKYRKTHQDVAIEDRTLREEQRLHESKISRTRSIRLSGRLRRMLEVA